MNLKRLLHRKPAGPALLPEPPPPGADPRGVDPRGDAPAGPPPFGPDALPPLAALRDALAALEPYGAHPDTGPIHDPLYELASSGDIAAAEALRHALLRHRDHPAAARVQGLLGPAFAPPPRGLDQVLTELGPWTHDDAVREVEHRLRAAARVRAVLEERLARELDERDRLARSANALALVGALLAAFALVGWTGALGLWSIDWMTPPTPPAMVAGSEASP